jgi:hypothetical protein
VASSWKGKPGPTLDDLTSRSFPDAALASAELEGITLRVVDATTVVGKARPITVIIRVTNERDTDVWFYGTESRGPEVWFAKEEPDGWTALPTWIQCETPLCYHRLPAHCDVTAINFIDHGIRTTRLGSWWSLSPPTDQDAKVVAAERLLWSKELQFDVQR